MRTRLLFLAPVVIAVSACSSAASPSPAGQAPPGNSLPTLRPQVPAASPYDGVTFDDPGVNPVTDPREDRESTFGLDVDTASYTIARRFIEDGNLPDRASVRIEEFVNYFDQDYEAPQGDAFAIHADGGPSPFLPDGEVLLRIGLKAREVADESRPDAALTFVIDVSGSMDRENRLELVKQSLRLLVEELGSNDSVGIVVYGSEARVVLAPTSARFPGEILDAIDSLHPEGSTNAEAGLRLGYAMARESLLEGGINRVVLASDGVANVGATDPGSILEQIRDDAEAGIQLVSVGFGMGNFNDALLEQLADDGDGFYAYVDDIEEARRLFVDDLTSTLQSVALDAKVQVEFDPAAVESYRLIGFENRDIADRDFRNDDVDAGAIGAGHEVTALYAIQLSNEGSSDDRLATVRLRWTDPESRGTDELSADVTVAEMAGSFDETAATFKLDALVAATAERFRGSRYGDAYTLRDVLEVADEIGRDLPDSEDVGGFLDLLEQATRLEG